MSVKRSYGEACKQLQVTDGAYISASSFASNAIR